MGGLYSSNYMYGMRRVPISQYTTYIRAACRTMLSTSFSRCTKWFSLVMLCSQFWRHLLTTFAFQSRKPHLSENQSGELLTWCLHMVLPHTSQICIQNACILVAATRYLGLMHAIQLSPLAPRGFVLLCINCQDIHEGSGSRSVCLCTSRYQASCYIPGLYVGNQVQLGFLWHF